MSPHEREPPLYAHVPLERMYESTWSTVCLAALVLPKYRFHTTTSSCPVVSNPNSEPYGYGVAAHPRCRACMFSRRVPASAEKVAFAAPSVVRSSSTSRATVPSMKPTPARPSFNAVFAAR